MKTLTGSLILAFIYLSNTLVAQSLPSVATVVKNTNERNDGQFLSQNLTLELVNERGNKIIQVTKAYRKYYGKEKRQALFYQSPTNIKGTGFLTFDYPDPDKEDDRWLYLPALRKTRRISGAEKGGYFLGTDLTYEDINLNGKLSEYDYNYTIEGKEIIDGHECYTIVGIPKSEKIKKELKYSKIKSWIDVEIWMPRKVDFWDLQEAHLKTLLVQDIKMVSGIWTAYLLHVSNHKTMHQTFLRASNIDYKSPIDDGLFTEESLVNGY